MNIKFKVSPLFVLVWTAIFFFDRENMFAFLLASVAVHEISHIAMIYLTGGRVEKIEFSALGLIIGMRGIVSYRNEIITAAAGPMGSLVFGIIAGKMGVYVLSGMNIALFVFNSLPVMPLDGGRILRAIIAWKWGEETGERVLYITSVAVFVLLGAAGVIMRQANLIYFASVLGIYSCKNELNGVKFRVIP